MAALEQVRGSWGGSGRERGRRLRRVWIAALAGLAWGLGCTPWERPSEVGSEVAEVVEVAEVAEVVRADEELPEVAPAELPAPVYPPAPPQELLIERKSPDGSIVAEWWGEPPRYEAHESPYPLEYAIQSLWFRFPEDGGVEPFSPTGTLHFSDWQTSIFSPDGARIVLAQGRFGPYHMILPEHLRGYLQGERAADLEFGWLPSSSESFVPVHGPVRWRGPQSIEVVYDSETPETREYRLP